MSTGITKPTRRNGKPPSCEPCRKSKVRCDHKLPVCDRCISRQIEKSCVYHPAPMTKVSASFNRAHLAPQSRQDPPRNVTQKQLSELSLNHTILPPIQAIRSSVTSTDTATEPEFLGPTSFSAVINEDRAIAEHDAAQPFDQENKLESVSPDEQISNERLLAGEGVLQLLLDLLNQADNIERYLNLTCTCMVPDPFVKACVRAVQDTFRDSIHTHKSPKLYIRSQVAILFRNMSKPLGLFTSIRAEEYHTLFTGTNIRWEIVGFVLSMLGVSLKYDVNKRNKSISSGNSLDEPQCIPRILDAVEYCTSICHSFNSVNHQALWLFYGEACLKSLLYGDTSFRVWRSIGELTSIFSALGLHSCDSKYKHDIPFYQRELRRRYAAQIFSMDKTISTMLGRPPRISGAYCTDITPSDIDDSVLLLENAQLTRALLNVNEHGWNIDGIFRGSTWRRLKLIISRFREEVLGLCLGVPNGNIELLARDILSRHEETWDQIPSDIKYDETTGSSHVAPRQRYFMMTTYMDQNYNRFLLHQKLVKDRQCSRESLYKIARSQLATVLQLISMSDFVYDMRRTDNSWFILYYGLPSASILAVDLLKQSVRGQKAPIHNRGEQEMIKRAIPRAEVIQNLAVFVSNLQRASCCCRKASTEPCKWAYRVLSYILGEILDPKPNDHLFFSGGGNIPEKFTVNVPPLSSQMSSGQGPDITGVRAADSGADVTLDINEFLDWIGEADWAEDSSELL